MVQHALSFVKIANLRQESANMFGERLASERKRLGLGQQQVADLLSVSRPTISMLETGRACLDVQRLLVLGTHGFDVLKVLTGEPAQVAAGRVMDWNLCMIVADRVDAWVRARGIRLSAEKREIVVKHLYLQFAGRGHIDEAIIDETLKVAA